MDAPNQFPIIRRLSVPVQTLPFIPSFHTCTSSFNHTMATAAPATAMKMPATWPAMVAAALELDVLAAPAVLVPVLLEPVVCEEPPAAVGDESSLLGAEAVSSELDEPAVLVLGADDGVVASREAVRQYESTCCWTEGARMSLGQLL